MQAQTEAQAAYNVAPASTTSYTRPEIVAQALAALEADMRKPGRAFDSPMRVKDYIRLHNGRHEDQYVERFSVLFLDSQNCLIACDEVSIGTLTQTSVYPREMVRSAMRHNAAAVILTHNHPSGAVRPSAADERLTQSVKAALSLVDVRVLDHFITSGVEITSMAEMGLI